MYETRNANGMVYLVITTNGDAYGGGAVYSVATVNLTKDALECEYYRKQLKDKK
jgi:hypothetical protein